MEINNVTIEFLGHAGFLLSNGDKKKIFIDPYHISEAATHEKADFIFITHSHYDHCSIRDITRLSKPGTVVVMPADVQSKITKVEGIQMQIIEIGDEIDFGKFKVEALPSYNIGKTFHTKKDGWLGYLFKFDKVIIYHAGDTNKIPEMKNLTGYGKHGQEFVALLPVSGTFTMDADEAAEVAQLLNVDLAIPMHYGAGVDGSEEDAVTFVNACKQLDVYAQILEKK